jgi:hypothetical protein
MAEEKTLDTRINEVVNRFGLGRVISTLAAVGMLTGYCSWQGIHNANGNKPAYAGTMQDGYTPDISVAPEEYEEAGQEDTYTPNWSGLPLFQEGDQTPWERYRNEHGMPKETEKPPAQQRRQRHTPHPIALDNKLGDCYHTGGNQLTFVFDNPRQGFTAGVHYGIEGRTITTQKLGTVAEIGQAEKRSDCFLPNTMRLESVTQKPLYTTPEAQNDVLDTVVQQ